MTDNTIMENLHNYLPKDLVNIVEEYSKDRTNYNKVVTELTKSIHFWICQHNYIRGWYNRDPTICFPWTFFCCLMKCHFCKRTNIRLANIRDEDMNYFCDKGCRKWFRYRRTREKTKALKLLKEKPATK